MKLFNWMKHYVPKYAVLPLLGCLALNMLAYYGSRLFNLSMTSYDLSLPLDHRIPLVPPFIVVYMLSFVYWWFAYMIIAADSPERRLYDWLDTDAGQDCIKKSGYVAVGPQTTVTIVD